MVAQAPAQRDLPQVFGRYVLLKRLSRGGMGEIFLSKLGEIQGFEKPVIVKKILPNLSADQEFVKRFIDEAQVAIKLNHANIAQVYEVGKVEGDYFLAIEYVEGRDLRRMITRCRELHTRLPPDLCLYVARELAAGLGYAHRRTDASGRALALVHCDISPPNVMVSFEGEVKVIDFGIAKSAIRIAGSNPNMGFGKFGYMAPEQLVRGGVVDKRTDIYAAGVVLYELLTGERLFVFPEGADYKQIARIVTKGEFTPVSQRDPRLDPSLDPIVGKALAPRADDRYQTAEEFRDAIQSKLYQMNPTISGDALAHFVRGLFGEEIEEERAMIASTRAVDVSEFQSEIVGSATHTVTFARAGLFGRPRTKPGGGDTSSKLGALALDISSPAGARRTGFVVGAAIAAMIAGGAVVYLAARKPQPPAPPVVVQHVVDPPPVEHPIVQPLPTPPRHDPPSPVVTPLPPEHHGSHHAKPPTKVAHNDVVKPPPDPAALKSSVESKFRSVRGEYFAFRGEYGGRLETQWNAITNEITFGHGDGKYEKLDQMLDALRREMGKVRNGD